MRCLRLRASGGAGIPIAVIAVVAGVKKNADGSYDIYFGPKPPAGKEGNWLETVPGKSWFTILRM